MYATNKQWNSFKMSKQKSKSTKMKLLKDIKINA